MLAVAVIAALDDGQHLHHHIGLLPQHSFEVAGDQRRSRVLQLLRAFEPDQLDKRKAGLALPLAHPVAIDALQGDELRFAPGEGTEIRQQGGAYLLEGVDGDGPETKVGHGKTSWL